MVDAFSSYARTPKMQPRRVDLNGLVTDVVELYRNEQGPQLVETEIEPDLPALEADPDRLRQILHNLVKNAIEAQRGAAGGDAPPPRVRVRTSRVAGPGAGAVELHVSDDGPGYPEEILETVFEPYVTTKPKGSGLGLAIVKKIAEEHGGSVRAQNDPGGGARVVIRLPVATGADAEHAAPVPARRSAG